MGFISHTPSRCDDCTQAFSISSLVVAQEETLIRLRFVHARPYCPPSMFPLVELARKLVLSLLLSQTNQHLVQCDIVQHLVSGSAQTVCHLFRKNTQRSTRSANPFRPKERSAAQISIPRPGGRAQAYNGWVRGCLSRSNTPRWWTWPLASALHPHKHHPLSKAHSAIYAHRCP